MLEQNIDVLNDFIKENNIPFNKQHILMKMFKNNKDLLKNINISFVKSDYFDKLDFYLLQNILSLNVKIQLDFLDITNEKRDFFVELINRFSKRYYQFPYVNALLTNFKNPEFVDLIDNINLHDLTNDDYLNLSFILTSKKNELNVKTLEQVRNIDNLLMQKINYSKNIDEFKNYMLLKKINLSYSEVRLICQKYCYDLNHFHVKSLTLENLIKLKKIILSTSFDEASQIIESLEMDKITYPDFQTMCQNLYEDEFNAVLFNPNDKKYTIYDGCKIIDAGLEFNMIVRANNALSDTNISLSPKDYWNNNIRSSLSFSASLLSNNFFRNASFFGENAYIIGFSNIPKNCMAECCMGDNATIYNREYTLDIRSYDDEREIYPHTGDFCGQQFRPLKEMIKHGSGEYQEVTLERFFYEDGGESRLQPSYVIYFKRNEDYESSTDFKKVIEVAKSFDIPIVLIDLKKVVLNEKDKIEKLLFDEITIDNIINSFTNYINLINSFSSEDKSGELSSVFGVGDFTVSINNMLKNYLYFLDKKNYKQEFYQELLDRLILLNDEKSCFNVGLLIRLKQKHNLKYNFEKYNEIIYGITYKNHSSRINTQSSYENLEKIYNFILENNLQLTDEVYDNKDIFSIIENCKIEKISLTQEIISYNLEEFKNYLDKKRIIKKLDFNPTEEILNEFFKKFSDDEIKNLLQPVIDKIRNGKKYHLIELLKQILKQRGLDDFFDLEYSKDENFDSFDFGNMGDFFGDDDVSHKFI